ncbi:DUF2284 domain-containing protein, partial [Chloroflexota bacterium]
MMKKLADKGKLTQPAEEKLTADLKRYRKLALDMDAEEARIIPASDIPQRIRTKMCLFFPRCIGTGTAWFRPPTWETPWEYAKAMLASYHYAMVIKTPMPVEAMTGPFARIGPPDVTPTFIELGILQYKKYLAPEDIEYWQDQLEQFKAQEAQKTLHTPWVDNYAIARVIEAEARKDGHQFALTIISGTCALKHCAEFGAICVALKTGICRHPGKSRPYGVATMYLDYPLFFRKVGWQAEVAGFSKSTEDMP